MKMIKMMEMMMMTMKMVVMFTLPSFCHLHSPTMLSTRQVSLEKKESRLYLYYEMTILRVRGDREDHSGYVNGTLWRTQRTRTGRKWRTVWWIDWWGYVVSWNRTMVRDYVIWYYVNGIVELWHREDNDEVTYVVLCPGATSSSWGSTENPCWPNAPAIERYSKLVSLDSKLERP